MAIASSGAPIGRSPADPNVLVIGGGIAGLFCAYFLRQAGHSVTLVERMTIGDPRGCSSGNTGFVGIGGAPMAGPGTLGNGLRSLLRPDDRLAVPPTLDPDRLRWLLRLRRAGSQDEVRRVAAVMLEMKRRSLEILREARDSTGPGTGFSATGMVQAYKSPASFARARQAVPVAVAGGVPLRVLSPEELRAIEPDCDFDIAGALYNDSGGFMHAPDFAIAFAEVLAGLGVQLLDNCAVLGFEARDGSVLRVVTDAGVLHPDEVVLAAGSWSGALARQLDIRLPVQPVRGYAVTVERPRNGPRGPVHLVEGTVAVRALGDRLRFAGDLTLAGMSRSISRRRVARLVRTVREHLPSLTWDPKPQVWVGLRPCTPDSLPLIGRAPGWRNLSIAAGHGHNGMGLAPVAGQLLAQLLDGKPTAMDASPLRVGRYSIGSSERGER
ncbi:MAG: FAD-dependent oxidoreductase [Jatrophihabitantaceae bacterium]